MWKLEGLRSQNMTMTLINGEWVPKRPLNGRKEYMSIRERIRDAWLVFSGRAEAFMWPEDSDICQTPVASDSKRGIELAGAHDNTT